MATWRYEIYLLVLKTTLQEKFRISESEIELCGKNYSLL